MKASLITLATIHNYGSVLQAYASGRILQKYFDEVELVDYESINGRKDESLRDALSRRGYNRAGIKRLAYTLAWQLDWSRKDKVFDGFIRSKFPFSVKYRSQEEINTNPPIADIYFSGSDMLWSSVLNQGHEERQFYLDYAPAGKKRIALSACIGEVRVDAEEQSFLKPLLSQYDSISMREESGSAILGSMGIESTVLLDPTLLLDSAEWDAIANDPRAENYILVYFLHEHPEAMAKAKAFAERNDFDLIRISFNPKKRDDDKKIVYMPSIEDFLGFFRGAQYVLTDSFHGVAFSMIFHRQFNVVAPPRFMSRLDNILELTNTQERVVVNDYSPLETPVDFEKVDRVISSYQDKAEQFLESAIEA